MPCVFEGWRCTGDTRLDAATLAVLRADDYVNRGYFKAEVGGAALFVGYYDSQRQGDAIHSPQNCLPGSGWASLSTVRVELGSGGVRLPATEMTVQKDLQREIVVYWYEGRGRRLASDYANKFWLVADAIRLHRSDGALVRIVAPTASAAEAFARAISPRLSPYVP